VTRAAIRPCAAAAGVQGGSACRYDCLRFLVVVVVVSIMRESDNDVSLCYTGSVTITFIGSREDADEGRPRGDTQRGTVDQHGLAVQPQRLRRLHPVCHHDNGRQAATGALGLRLPVACSEDLLP